MSTAIPRSRAAVTPAALEIPLSTVTMSVGDRRRGQRDDLRREPVAELEAVRNQEVDRRESPADERPHDERGAGRTVRVEIADDQDAPALAVREQQRRGRADAFERPDGQQPLEARCELLSRANAARRVHTPEHRMEVAREHGVASRCGLAPHDVQIHESGRDDVGIHGWVS